MLNEAFLKCKWVSHWEENVHKKSSQDYDRRRNVVEDSNSRKSCQFSITTRYEGCTELVTPLGVKLVYNRRIV